VEIEVYKNITNPTIPGFLFDLDSSVGPKLRRRKNNKIRPKIRALKVVK
jgi:hypothetical protein